MGVGATYKSASEACPSVPHPLNTVRAMNSLTSLLPALLPQRCPGCGLQRPGACPYCRALLLAGAPGEAPEGMVALRRYDDLVRDLITGLKYRRNPNVVQWFVDIAHEVHHGFDSVDVITWAPTSRQRRHSRGFDQAELIARALARRWFLPVRPLLVRGAGPAQTGLDRRQRLGGPEFRARRVAGGAHVLVIDDVVTTGATLRAAIQALGDAGAARVSALALAATPSPIGLSSPSRPEAARPGR